MKLYLTLPFCGGCCDAVFFGTSSSSSTDCAATADLWGERQICTGGHTREVWRFTRCRGWRKSGIAAHSNPGTNRCIGNNTVLQRVNNSDASDIFWHREGPSAAWSDNGCRGSLLQLQLLQSCAAQTDGEKENLNSSNADSWHC